MKRTCRWQSTTLKEATTVQHHEKILVINADDFGRSPKVNDGILNVWQNGLVSSTTIMANFPAFSDAVDKIKKFKIPAGLHINLTDGQPVSRPDVVPSLLDSNGQFFRKYEFYRRVILRRFNPDDIAAEVSAQLFRCINSGVELDHYDGHHHVHALKGVAPIVHTVMATYKALPFRRISRPHKSQSFSAKIQQTAIHLFEDKNPELPFHSTFWGFDFMDQQNKRAAFEIMLEQIKPGVHEMMCHPGYKSIENISYYNAQRQEEVELLCDDSLESKINELDIQLCSYKDVMREHSK